MTRRLHRWEPMGDLVSLRDAMGRMFEESFFRPLAPFGLWGRCADLTRHTTPQNSVDGRMWPNRLSSWR
jgi:hypothetical protein